MDFLEILDPNGRRRHVRLERPRMLIGREPNCDVCLPHPNVSRRHAQLQQTEQGWLLQDLNSLNHVYVEEQIVEQIVLEPGKLVRIGDFRLCLRTAPTPIEPDEIVRTDDDSSPSWPGLEPGWLEQLQGFQRSLLKIDQSRPLLERLAEEFKRVARPQLVAVCLADRDPDCWEVVLGSTDCQESRLRVARQRIKDDTDVQSWSDVSPSDRDTPYPGSAMSLIFPMKGRSGIIGHVYVDRPKRSPMPLSLQRYLSLYAHHAGIVWENLQITELRLAHKAYEAELRQARQIQVELFPAKFEVDRRINAFGVNLPSVKVSGDYYDLVKVSDDVVGFVIADAMGHGMPAALLMAAVRATVRMGLTLRLSWQALFAGVESIVAQARGNNFVTGLIGLLDLHRRELQLAIAGHPPPSILIGGLPCPVPSQCQTQPWGLNMQDDWEPATLPLGGRDWSILCYTDGVTEAGSQDNRAFGTRRLLEFHAQHSQDLAEDLCQSLLSAVAAQQETDTLADDQTILVLRSAM